MRKVYTIAEREVRALLTAPIGYVVMGFFLFVAGLFFYAPLKANVGTLRALILNTTVWLIFLLPALTMRLVAEEKKQGTIELLMTSPVTETQVIIGKYLGVLVYYGIILFSTLQFVFMLGMVRKPDAPQFFPGYTGLLLNAAAIITLTLGALFESRSLGIAAAVLGVATLICTGFAAAHIGEWGPVLTGYVGLLVFGAVFLAIGLLCSALTRNQIIAWVSAAGILLMLTFLIGFVTQGTPPNPPELMASPGFGDYVSFGLSWAWYAIGQVFHALDLQEYLRDFANGVLDLRNVVLYVSIIAASLFFAIRGLAVSRAA